MVIACLSLRPRKRMLHFHPKTEDGRFGAIETAAFGLLLVAGICPKLLTMDGGEASSAEVMIWLIDVFAKHGISKATLIMAFNGFTSYIIVQQAMPVPYSLEDDIEKQFRTIQKLVPGSNQEMVEQFIET